METDGTMQMLQVSHHVSSPRQTADGGVEDGAGEGGEGVESGVWEG